MGKFADLLLTKYGVVESLVPASTLVTHPIFLLPSVSRGREKLGEIRNRKARVEAGLEATF